MSWLVLRLGLGVVWGRFRSAGALILSNPFAAVCCGLVIVCMLCWHELSVKSRQVARLTAEIVQFHDAQSRATEIAQEALHHQEMVYQQQAKEADDAYQSKLADADARVSAYIASHRVDGVRTDSASGPSATPAPAKGDSAKGGDGPGGDPDMVAVMPHDIEVCTVNTRRLQAVRDWAVSLGQ